MQTALLSLAAVSSVVVAAGSLLAWYAMRRAPQGIETEAGFQTVEQPMGTIHPFPVQYVRSPAAKKVA